MPKIKGQKRELISFRADAKEVAQLRGIADRLGVDLSELYRAAMAHYIAFVREQAAVSQIRSHLQLEVVKQERQLSLPPGYSDPLLDKLGVEKNGPALPSQAAET